jgi:predicted dehydrogenase
MIHPPLRGALIGAGDVTAFHMQAWDKLPQAEIIAVADPDLERAGQRADEYGIDRTHTYASLEDLLASEKDLDFVDIAAPPETHLSLVETAAASGLHILCQKPFAPSLGEARRMIEICERTGVQLSVNENWRWRPWYHTLRKMVRDGAIGRPVYARIFAHNSYWLPGATHPGHRFLHWPRVILFDMGVHYADIFRFLFGEAESVYARLARLNGNLIGDDRAVVVVNFNWLTAVIDLSWSSYAPWGYPSRTGPSVEDLRIEGDRGTLELVPDLQRGDQIRLTTAAGCQEQPAHQSDPFDAYLGSYIAAQAHFIDCLLSGRTPETNGRDNLESLAIILAAYQSAETNRVIDLHEFKQREAP